MRYFHVTGIRKPDGSVQPVEFRHVPEYSLESMKARWAKTGESPVYDPADSYYISDRPVYRWAHDAERAAGSPEIVPNV